MPENSSRPVPARSSAAEAFDRLLQIMVTLRSPEGCPWDLQQDLDSLRPYLVEETFEVLEALDGRDLAGLRQELGDLLFQIVFQSRIAEERGAFTMADVVTGIADKLTRRHPHVFGDEKGSSVAEVERRWAELKRAERIAEQEGGVRARPSALDGVPKQAPALLRAERTGEKAAAEGFDWPDLAGVRAKLDEELAELDTAVTSGDRRRVQDELGDVLFTLCNLARWLKTPAEDALREAVHRFEARFSHVETALADRGARIRDVDPAEADRLWREAKELVTKS
jgi:MazG family protein